MQSNFVKWKGVIIVLAIVVLAIAIAFYVAPATPDDAIPVIKNEATATPNAVLTPTFASSPVSSPTIPLISPVSPPPGGPISSLDPEELEPIVRKGLLLYESKDYEAVIELFTGILVHNSTDIVAYNTRGSAYLALGDNEKALDDFSKAIELDRRFPYAYYNRGRLYSSLGQYDEALADLERSIELSPDDFGYRASGNMGLIYHRSGDYDQALDAFETSISFNEDENADVYYFRGETHTALENYDAAIADYQAAIDRFSSYAAAYQGLGYAYYKNGQYDQALENLNRALEISPQSPGARLYLALIYVTADELEIADREVSQATRLLAELPEDEQELILNRVLTELEILAQEQPDQASAIEEIIGSMPGSN